MQDSRKTDSPCRFGLPQEILFKHSFVIYKPTDLSNGRLLITVNDYTNKTSLLACGVLSVVKTLQVTYQHARKTSHEPTFETLKNRALCAFDIRSVIRHRPFSTCFFRPVTIRPSHTLFSYLPRALTANRFQPYGRLYSNPPLLHCLPLSFRVFPGWKWKNYIILIHYSLHLCPSRSLFI